MALTPLHLEILIHYHASPHVFPRSSQCSDNYTRHLVSLGLLENAGVDVFDGCKAPFQLTEKGRAWLERVLSTPMPKQAWVWE